MTDQEAVDFVSEFKNAQEASDALMKKSLEKGSTDNLSVMIIFFQDEVVENPVEKEKKVEENNEGEKCEEKNEGGEKNEEEKKEEETTPAS